MGLFFKNYKKNIVKKESKKIKRKIKKEKRRKKIILITSGMGRKKYIFI